MTKKLAVELPYKMPARNIRIVNEYLGTKGVKKELERTYRRYLRNRYPDFFVPICCEFCMYVGLPYWHCHNSASKARGINVHCLTVCPEWEPNSGLLMFLDWRVNENR